MIDFFNFFLMPHEVYLALLYAYLIGSIPFGVGFGRMFGNKNVREEGSQNIGATNVYRVSGKLAGLLTFLFDTLKGVVATVIGSFMSGGNLTFTCVCAFLAVFGHIFPIWLGFRGGKGVATTLAIVALMNYTLGAISVIIWIVMFLYTRTVSIASLVCLMFTCILAIFMVKPQVSIMILLATVLVVLKHKSNIERIMSDQELKFK